MSTYDQWKAEDAAGDDADARAHLTLECERAEHAACVPPYVDAPCDCECHAEPLVVMVKCRACGADFPNPYGGGVEAAVCDACLEKPVDDAAIDRIRRG